MQARLAPQDFKTRETQTAAKPKSPAEDKAPVTLHRRSGVDTSEAQLPRSGTVRDIARQMEALAPVFIEDGPARQGYVNTNNLAAFDNVRQDEMDELQLEVGRRVQKGLKSYATAGRTELRLGALKRERACIQRGCGRFPTEGEAVDAFILEVHAAIDKTHLVYFLRPFNTNETWLWEGTDPLVFKKVDRLPSPPAPAVTTPSGPARTSAARTTPSLESKSPEPDANPLVLQFKRFYASKRAGLQSVAESSGHGEEHDRVVRAAHAQILALANQQRCIEKGSGWFRVAGHWERGMVTALPALDVGKSTHRLGIRFRTPAGQVLTWDGGQCQANEPLDLHAQPASGCCTIL